MTNSFKYIKRTFLAIVALLLILFTVVFIYVSYNKKSIILQVTSEISKKLNGKVTIGEVELSFIRTFPQVSVLLQQVAISDTQFHLHKHYFFKGDEVYAKLSILDIIKKQPTVSGIKIKRAEIYLYKDSSGYSNEYLFKPKKDTIAESKTSTKENQLRSLQLEKVNITIEDQQKEKFHNISVRNFSTRIKDDAVKTSLATKADMMIHGLGFNLANGSFLNEKNFTGNFEVSFLKVSKQLQFDSIDVKIAGHPFNLSGKFDLEGLAPQFSLEIHTKNVDYTFLKSILTAKIDTALSIVSLDKKIDAHAIINGPLRGGDPFINATWSAKKTKLITPFLDFDEATFSGLYTNEVVKGMPRKDPNSKIVINNFSALWNKLPVTSTNIEILNLSVPLLTCDLQSQFPLATLNKLINSNSIQLKSGDGTTNLQYKGPVEKNTNSNSFLNGTVSFKNGTVLYAPRNVEMKSVSGSLIFKNSDVIIENLQCIVLNNKIVMDGQAKNLLTLLSTDPNKAVIDWNIYSPSLNLTPFTYLLQARKNVKASNTANSNLSKLASSIDDVLDKGRLNVNLRAAKLIYKKFEAGNAVADISLLQDRYLVNRLSMNHSGGNINLKGSMVAVKNNYHQTQADVVMNNVDVKHVFASFNNFGQDGIQSQNLEGKLTATVNASLVLDSEGKPYPSTVKSIVDFSLKNGALNNYEPIKKIQQYIFKKRDFENIQFAELKDRLEINNQEIKINRMEIQSSVITMFVEGLYSMRGNTDMSVQVPLSNLKKRGADYIPENVGTDAKLGSSIFLRGRPGSDGNIQFKPDLFNRYKKDKEKNGE